MKAGKLRVLAACGVAAGMAALVGGCTSSSSSLAPGATAPPATPTVTPTAVPVLGSLKLGTFPDAGDGVNALTVCEQWAGLRGQYVTQVKSDSVMQLELWFSSPVWLSAFSANSPLKSDPNYSNISTAFGLVTAADVASVANARMLDAACASAD